MKNSKKQIIANITGFTLTKQSPIAQIRQNNKSWRKADSDLNTALKPSKE
jgi:hypothetical protein